MKDDTEETMARKTKLMQRVEKEFSRPLERLLPEKVNEVGLSATAEELGVSKATLGYWLLKLGINVRRVALAPGETLEVKRIS
jgi:transcriptional regulator with PAS, ATPase and Fis domain|tara:strand:+ start:2878 stop:3126 length:249 start_codon:yes stop_codon:yes gene_type:complete